MAKKSTGKLSVGGRKWAMRAISADGVAEAEVIGIGEMPDADGNDRRLLVALMRDGEILRRPTLESARAQYQRSLAELPPRALQLSRGEPAIPTIYEGGQG